MAIIGTFGDIVFSVSNRQVKTIESLRWESSAQYATHNRHLRPVLLEFTGTDPDKITITTYFSAFLGVNPRTEIAKLLNAQRSGRHERLIIGSWAYGKHRWVITNMSKNFERFDSRGNLLIARVSVSFMAYSGR